MASVAIWLLTLMIIFVLVQYDHDLLAPAVVMVGMWGGVLGLYYLKLIDYYELTPSTLFLMVLGLLGFIVGSMFVNLSIGGRRPQDINLLEKVRESVDENRLFFFCSLIFLVGMIGEYLYLRALNEFVGLKYALENPIVYHYQAAVGELRELGAINLLASTNIVNVIILLTFLILFRGSSRSKFVWFQFILTLVVVFFRTSRTGIFIPIIWGTVVWVFLKGGLWLGKRDIIPTAFIISVLVTIFLTISSLIGKTESAISLKPYWRRDVPFNGGIASLYHYTTSSLPAFQIFVEQTHEQLFGRSTFLPILRFGQLFDPSIELLETKRHLSLVPVPTNVYTYLASFYEDFGIFGIWLLPLLLGSVTTYLYFHWKTKPSLPILWFSALMTTTIFWSTFQSILVFIIIWYYAVVVILVGKLSRASRKQEKLAYSTRYVNRLN